MAIRDTVAELRQDITTSEDAGDQQTASRLRGDLNAVSGRPLVVAAVGSGTVLVDLCGPVGEERAYFRESGVRHGDFVVGEPVEGRDHLG